MGALAGLLFLIVLLLIVIVLKVLRAKDTPKDKRHTGFSMEHLAGNIFNQIANYNFF